MLSKELLLRFVEDQLGVDMGEIDEETALFSSGIIDSASLVDLVVFVESEGNIRFSPDDIRLDNLDSIRRILEFVNGRPD